MENGSPLGKLFNYKSKNYTVVDIIKMKHPVSRKWVDAALYKPLQSSGSLITRELEEFLKKFERGPTRKVIKKEEPVSKYNGVF